MFRSRISKAKDAAVAKVALMFLRSKAERYGEISKLDLDSSAKIINAEVKLRGEERCLISEAKYRLEGNGKETILVLHELKVSKEWVQNLFQDHWPEIRIKIPGMLGRLLD